MWASSLSLANIISGRKFVALATTEGEQASWPNDSIHLAPKLWLSRHYLSINTVVASVGRQCCLVACRVFLRSPGDLSSSSLFFFRRISEERS